MKPVPFLQLADAHRQIRSEMLEAFEQVYDSNWFIIGEKLSSFEMAYARFNEVNHCVGVSNGLDAIRIALISLDIGQDDEVILPANTFIATALAVLHVGAKPVFVDPDEQSYNMDPASLMNAVTLKTKAVIPVHLYGQSCNMIAIMDIANKLKLPVIEDNAQAQGARFRGKLTGSWGKINATSFYPGKNLGALGDAGGITTNDESLAAKARTLRNYGAEQKYLHTSVGYNMRMDECQAAFLTVKLKYLERWTAQRRQIAARYNSKLAGIGDIKTPSVHVDADHVYHLYVIRTQYRDELRSYLASKQIATLIHYPVPLHKEKIFQHWIDPKKSFPVAESIAATCLSLPLWVGMDSDIVDHICSEISNYFNG